MNYKNNLCPLFFSKIVFIKTTFDLNLVFIMVSFYFIFS